MHHNQIINSSIIINIIVKGSHGKRDDFDDPIELLLPSILQEIDVDDDDQDNGKLPEQDYGRQKIEDRYQRIYFGQLSNEVSSNLPTEAPTEASMTNVPTEVNDDWF